MLDTYKPVVWEYSRLNITANVLSKRRLNKLVMGGFVAGWDDPRLLTLSGGVGGWGGGACVGGWVCGSSAYAPVVRSAPPHRPLDPQGMEPYAPRLSDTRTCVRARARVRGRPPGLRRRGVPPLAINNFCREIGITRNENIIPMHKLEHHIRAELDASSPRALAVLRPLKVGGRERRLVGLGVFGWRHGDSAMRLTRPPPPCPAPLMHPPCSLLLPFRRGVCGSACAACPPSRQTPNPTATCTRPGAPPLPPPRW